jgi:S-adenosylmethionine decarboxylase
MTQAVKKEGLGYHVLMEFHGCSQDVIADSDKVEQILLKATEISKAHVVESIFHKFNPHGVSGVIVISESHFTIHTWPEYEYAALDLFSCSRDIDLDAMIEYLKKHLKPKSVSQVELKRGVV